MADAGGRRPSSSKGRTKQSVPAAGLAPTVSFHKDGSRRSRVEDSDQSKILAGKLSVLFGDEDRGHEEPRARRTSRSTPSDDAAESRPGLHPSKTVELRAQLTESANAGLALLKRTEELQEENERLQKQAEKQQELLSTISELEEEVQHLRKTAFARGASRMGSTGTSEDKEAEWQGPMASIFEPEGEHEEEMKELERLNNQLREELRRSEEQVQELRQNLNQQMIKRQLENQALAKPKNHPGVRASVARLNMVAMSVKHKNKEEELLSELDQERAHHWELAQQHEDLKRELDTYKGNLAAVRAQAKVVTGQLQLGEELLRNEKEKLKAAREELEYLRSKLRSEATMAKLARKSVVTGTQPVRKAQKRQVTNALDEQLRGRPDDDDSDEDDDEEEGGKKPKLDPTGEAAPTGPSWAQYDHIKEESANLKAQVASLTLKQTDQQQELEKLLQRLEEAQKELGQQGTLQRSLEAMRKENVELRAQITVLTDRLEMSQAMQKQHQDKVLKMREVVSQLQRSATLRNEVQGKDVKRSETAKSLDSKAGRRGVSTSRAKGDPDGHEDDEVRADSQELEAARSEIADLKMELAMIMGKYDEQQRDLEELRRQLQQARQALRALQTPGSTPAAAVSAPPPREAARPEPAVAAVKSVPAAKSSPGRADTVALSGALADGIFTVEAEGRAETRRAVLYEEHLEYLRRKTKGSGHELENRIPTQVIQDFTVLADGFTLNIQGGLGVTMRLQGLPDRPSADLQAWTQALARVTARSAPPASPSRSPQPATPEPTPPVPPPAEAPRKPAPKPVEGPPADWQIPDEFMEQLRSRRAVLDKISAIEVPIHHGVLGIMDNGSFTVRFCVLYPNRLDCFGKPSEAWAAGRAPLKTITMAEVQGVRFETSSLGLLLARRGSPDIGAYVRTSQELHMWYKAFLSVLSPKPPPPANAGAAGGGGDTQRSRSQTPKRRIEEVLPPERHRSPEPKRKLSLFETRARREGGWKGVNTHRDAREAHKLIHGKEAEILIGASHPGSYVNPSLTDKPNPHDRPLSPPPGVSGKITGR